MDHITETARGVLEKRQASATPQQGYEPRADYAPAEIDLDGAYAALSDRQRLMGSLIQRVNSQRGLPPLDDTELLIRISDCAPVLEDIPDYALPECFTRAMKWHDYKQPFQMSEVATVWREMSESTRQELFEKSGIQALPAAHCEFCDDKGLMRIGLEKQPLNYFSTEQSLGMTRCVCRGRA